MSDTTTGSRAGSLVGHYLLRRRLGAGGFGEVYEAEDTAYHRIVALKLIAPPYSHSPAFQERLFREVQQAGRLHDPHIVPIHSWGEIDGQLYIDMHLIDGTDLATLLDRYGPLSPPRGVAIVGQIASALDAAHADQLIHCDVTPAKILITRYGFACLVDFGLANAAADARLTGTGTTIGAFAYMAPERFRPAKVTSRADIYALACVLFECLTGSPPYMAADRIGLMDAHLDSAIPRPSQVRPSIPRAFDEVVACGMAKDPAHRYASAGSLALAAYHALAISDQHQADTILDSSQAATLPDPSGNVGMPTLVPGAEADTQAPATMIQAPGRATENMATSPPAPAKSLAATPPPAVETVAPPTAWIPRLTPQRAPSAKPPRPQRISRRTRIVLIAASVLVIATVALPIAFLSIRPAPPRPPSASPVVLPFSGLHEPAAVAVDRAGNLFVADYLNNRVLKLPAGSDTQTVLPFAGLHGPAGVAVDGAGNLFVADYLNNRVLKLPAGSDTQTVLPVTDLNGPGGVAADTTGNVYVTDNYNRVLKLSAGSNTQTDLPFTGLIMPDDVAVDGAGNVFVTDYGNKRVLKLLAGSNTQVVVPFTGLDEPGGLAVDSADSTYVADDFSNRVLKLPAGSHTQIVLPFTDIREAEGVAVDSVGNVFVADYGNDRVLKLPAS
jgi:serine/threonine protein kinase, bacterial